MIELFWTFLLLVLYEDWRIAEDKAREEDRRRFDGLVKAIQNHPAIVTHHYLREAHDDDTGVFEEPEWTANPPRATPVDSPDVRLMKKYVDSLEND